MGHAGCQPPHCRQLLALTQARLQLLLAGLLLGDLAFGGGDAVEHLVQRAGQHHDLLRPAARCTMLAVAGRDPRHATRQLLQVLAHGRTVAKQDHHQRHAGQQPTQPGSDQPQATDVAFEVTPAPGHLQQAIDLPAALFQRNEIGIHRATVDALVLAGQLAAFGKLLDRRRILIRLHRTGIGRQLAVTVVDVGAIDAADAKHRLQHLLQGALVVLFQAGAERQAYRPRDQFHFGLQPPLAAALDRPQHHRTEAEHDCHERHDDLEQERAAQAGWPLPE